MKKMLLCALTLGFSSAAFCTTHNIAFANFQYTPNQIEAVVGDDVVWTGSFSSHPLASVSVPAGANSFSNNMGSTFTYTLTVPGTYTFHCTFHAQMTGTITVSEATNVADQKVTPKLSARVEGGELCIELPANHSGALLTVYNTLGQLVYTEKIGAERNSYRKWVSAFGAGEFIATIQTSDDRKKVLFSSK